MSVIAKPKATMAFVRTQHTQFPATLYRTPIDLYQRHCPDWANKRQSTCQYLSPTVFAGYWFVPAAKL